MTASIFIYSAIPGSNSKKRKKKRKMKLLAFSFAVLLALSFSELEAASLFSQNELQESGSETQVKTGSPVGECPLEDGAEILFLADSEDESIFYRCSGGSPVRMACPSGCVFDVKAKICIEPEVYAPVGKCPPVDGPFVVHLPDSEDRTIFYKCDKGTPIKMHCPAGLVFNPNLSVCVFDNEKAMTTIDGNCPDVDGSTLTILSDKVSCSTYYVCFGGKPFPATCPEGLLFNPEKSYCDFPNNVECHERETEDSEEDEE